MHNFEISEHVQSILKKLGNKDKALHEQVMKKMDEIVNAYDIEHYKNLKYNELPNRSKLRGITN